MTSWMCLKVNLEFLFSPAWLVQVFVPLPHCCSEVNKKMQKLLGPPPDVQFQFQLSNFSSSRLFPAPSLSLWPSKAVVKTTGKLTRVPHPRPPYDQVGTTGALSNCPELFYSSLFLLTCLQVLCLSIVLLSLSGFC